MIPNDNFNNVIDNLPQQTNNYGNKTYRIDTNKKCIDGYIEDIEALKQTIDCILDTERYEYLIYSYDHGVELQDLIGQDPLYVKADIHRIVEEALLQDDRIISVDIVKVTSSGENLYYAGRVESIYGDIEIRKEVG